MVMLILMRNLEKMISITSHFQGKYTLDLMLVGSPTNIASLTKLANETKNVKVVDPLPFDSLVADTAKLYDVGLYFTDSDNFNVFNMLPNKLFQYIQSRLCCIISPNPWMAEIVSKYKCGFVSGDFQSSSMIRLLDQLTLQDVTLAKKNAHVAASKLNWEEESEIIKDNVLNLI